MRICFVSKEVAGMRGGGIGTYVAEAGKALAAHGHEVWLITEHPGEERLHLLGGLPGFHRALPVGHGVPDEERETLFNGVPYYPHAYLVHQTLQKLDVTFDYIEFPDYEGEALIAFQEQRLFDTYGDTVLGLMLHSPTWECFSFDKQMHRANLYIREVCNIEDEAIRIAPMINSPSRGLRDQVMGRLGLERDVAIIRYPMELGAEHPPPPKPRGSLTELEFLYYGRIEPRKGIEEVVEAFSRMPELKLTLIGGDVPYSPYGRSYLDHCKKRAPANVEFAGAIPRPKLLKRLRKADVCIFPSLFENWPNTCIEAMAAARVVIGSEHGGMSEMIEHGVSGFHVDGRSPDAIVRVIREDLQAALPRLDAIGEAAARRMRAFSDQKTYCEALEERVHGWAAARPERRPADTEAHRVSVVIPFYKDRDTVGEAVDSAIAQTHRNLEILIVNDGSPLDDAGEILAQQRAKDPRIDVLEKPNGGLSSARNHAIERANGEFLLFLDADNVARPDYAKDSVTALLRCPESAFVTPHTRHFDADTGRTLGTYNPLPFDRATGLLINRFGDAGAFFRKSVFLDNGLRYDEVLISYEDWALWMDLAARGIGGERVPRVLYDYRVRSDSMMQVDGLPHHPALMGLLIHRHYPGVTPAERELLTTIFNVAGQSICRVAFGEPDQGRPAPAAESPRVEAPPPAPVRIEPDDRPPPPLRYKMVDEVSRLSRKVPGLNRLMRGTLGALFAVGRKLRRRP